MQLSSEMDKFLKFCYYDSYRNQFGLDCETAVPQQPAKKKVSLNSVLIRFVGEDIRFDSDEFQKEFTYKTCVFLLTPMTTLFDIYVQCLIFWCLVDNLNEVVSDHSNMIHNSKFKNYLGSIENNLKSRSENKSNYFSSKQQNSDQLVIDHKPYFVSLKEDANLRN
jgi:hypothetical protein